MKDRTEIMTLSQIIKNKVSNYLYPLGNTDQRSRRKVESEKFQFCFMVHSSIKLPNLRCDHIMVYFIKIDEK